MYLQLVYEADKTPGLTVVQPNEKPDKPTKKARAIADTPTKPIHGSSDQDAEIDAATKFAEDAFSGLKSALAKRSEELVVLKNKIVLDQQTSEAKKESLAAQEEAIKKREIAIAAKEQKFQLREVEMKKRELRLQQSERAPDLAQSTMSQGPSRASDPIDLQHNALQSLPINGNQSFDQAFQKLPARNQNAGMLWEKTPRFITINEDQFEGVLFTAGRMLFEIPAIKVDGNLKDTKFVNSKGESYSVYEKEDEDRVTKKLVQDLDSSSLVRYEDKLFVSRNLLKEHVEEDTF